MRNSTWLAMSALALAACTGTETDNPLVDFEHSGCKNHDTATALTFAADLGDAGSPLGDTSDYDGLFCFTYLVDDEGRGARIDVVNYMSPCGSDFTDATASFEGGTMKLALQRNGCTVARCGACFYDLWFDLKGPTASTELDVELSETGCEGTPLEREPITLTLPVPDSRQGTLCRAIHIEPVTCQIDDSCRSDLEHCVDGVCEPRNPF